MTRCSTRSASTDPRRRFRRHGGAGLHRYTLVTMEEMNTRPRRCRAKPRALLAATCPTTPIRRPGCAGERQASGRGGAEAVKAEGAVQLRSRCGRSWPRASRSSAIWACCPKRARGRRLSREGKVDAERQALRRTRSFLRKPGLLRRARTGDAAGAAELTQKFPFHHRHGPARTATPDSGDAGSARHVSWFTPRFVNPSSTPRNRCAR